MSSPTVFWQNPLRQALFWACVVMAGLTLGFGARSFGGLLAAALILAIGIVTTTTLRLEVTQDAVIARWLPTRSVSSAAITAIHVWPYYVRFLDKDGNAVMRTQPGWGKKQLVEIGEALGVPVYDHRTLLGLSQKEAGTLMRRPTRS
ncbi:MAG TPA: hypothetical protein VMA73_18255 [Streptosporangiaceae bacterium]|nr:hypothetical protein [Streptosporangiaceae bacterium]